LSAIVTSARLVPNAWTFAMDGLPTHRRVPDIVVLPGSREELIAVVRLLAALGVPFVPRGAGTGLSGGALADEGSVLLVLTRLTAFCGSTATTAGGRRARRRQREARRGGSAGRPAVRSPTRQVRARARSAATSPKTPAGRIA